MKTIYVVIETNGSYSDRNEYAIGAFTDEAEAKAFVVGKNKARAEETRGEHCPWLMDWNYEAVPLDGLMLDEPPERKA